MKKVSGADLLTFTKQNIEKLARATRRRLNFKVVPFASSSQRSPKMDKLFGNRAAIAASRFAPPASRNKCRACAAHPSSPNVCRQPGEKPIDLVVIREPIQAQFDRPCLRKRPIELPPHRRSTFRRYDRTNF